ncbi:MAG TPA: YceI family protein [Streptosporangiaceae bacterium]|jgi:polyisoprenoid-binding protein YceI|nr:YceI family protein [Streptosporangiaceae bacterium]
MTETTAQTPGTRPFQDLTVPEAGTFDLDQAHSRIGFSARHMMVSKVRGHFGDFTGSITIAAEPLDSTAAATIKTASIDTGSADRDKHLTGPDFLDAEKFPEITFRTIRVTARNGSDLTVLGDLTIKDVTKEIELDLDLEGVGMSPWGKQVLGFSMTAEINREDFGITWNVGLETGGVLVGKTVKLEIEGEAVRRD